MLAAARVGREVLMDVESSLSKDWAFLILRAKVSEKVERRRTLSMLNDSNQLWLERAETVVPGGVR